MSGFALVTDTTAFETMISTNDLVIAKFQTKSCFKCRQLEPGLKQVVERSAGALRAMNVDAEELATVADRYNIQGVPTLILFKEGVELSRCNGFQSTSMLREWVAPYLQA